MLRIFEYCGSCRASEDTLFSVWCDRCRKPICERCLLVAKDHPGWYQCTKCFQSFRTAELDRINPSAFLHERVEDALHGIGF